MNKKGEWLVVKKKYSALKGAWSLPAGFVDAGETADAAAIREVKEETGIDCRVEGMVGFRTGVLSGEISDNLAIFLLTPVEEDQQIVPQYKELSDVVWKTPIALKEDPNTSVMICEIAQKVIEIGLEEVVHKGPGDEFGYTCYKLFFN